MIECGYWASAGVLGVLTLICVYTRSIKGVISVFVSGIVVGALSYGYWIFVQDVFGGFESILAGNQSHYGKHGTSLNYTRN